MEENIRSEYILVNAVEDLVKQKAAELMETVLMCRCEMCFLDVCAIALNSLKPYYVTTTSGALLAQMKTVDKNYQTQIVIEVTRAIMLVKTSPRH